MLDIGWSELILISVVALIVIGPKDLPDMFRQLGRFTARMRGMAREFSQAMEQAANESGVKDVARDLKSVTTPQSLGLNAVKEAAARFEKWDPLKNAATPTKAPSSVAPATPLTAASLAATPPAAASLAATPPAAVPAATPAAQPVVGPQTQALRDKQAARQAIVADSTARLRALDTPAAATPEPAKPRRSTAKPAKPADPAKSATPATARKPAVPAKPASPEKPKARRKPKKADEA